MINHVAQYSGGVLGVPSSPSCPVASDRSGIEGSHHMGYTHCPGELRCTETQSPHRIRDTDQARQKYE